MNFGQKIGYAALSSATWLLSRLPLGFHRLMGRCLYFIMFRVLKYRTDDVMMNLSRAFPKMTISELKRVRRQFYIHLGKVFAEAMWFGSCTNLRRLRKSRIVVMSNPQVLNDLYEKGKSVVVLASHSGNWELYGGFETYGSYNGPLLIPEKDLSMVYRKQSDEVWNKFLLKNRMAPIVDKEHQDGLKETGDILRYVCEHRNDRKLYIFINDQRPYSASPANIEVEFMNQKTLTMSGSVKIAKKFGMAVVYAGLKPNGEGGYSMDFTPLCEDASNCDIKGIIDEYYKLLENDIREVPWNYLWTHRRWSYYN